MVTFPHFHQCELVVFSVERLHYGKKMAAPGRGVLAWGAEERQKRHCPGRRTAPCWALSRQALNTEQLLGMLANSYKD